MLRRSLRLVQYNVPLAYPYGPSMPAGMPYDGSAGSGSGGGSGASSYNTNANYSNANTSYYLNNAGGGSGGGGGGGGDYNRGRMLMNRPGRVYLNPAAFVEHVPRNTILNIVPQGRQYVVERLGRYHRTLDPGWWFVVPFLDKIRYCYSVKEQGVEIPNQSAITSDNVMVEIDGVLFLRIVDARKASYNIDNPVYNLLNLAQTTMRSEIGRLDLDTLFRERAQLNRNIVEVLRREANDWGIECKRYEIRDIAVSELVRRSMDLQADAERRKRQLVLQSEGEATAEVNRAEALQTAQRCAADAQKYTRQRNAEAEAVATTTVAGAVAESLRTVAAALTTTPGSNDAVALRVAEKYISTFGELARSTNTVVLGQNVGDPAAFATQALSVFNTISTATTNSTSSNSNNNGSNNRLSTNPSNSGSVNSSRTDN
ncbi:putative SPFH domain / Band 7 family protein [Trypanosoma theileri]|uniref:Putative SPFH domain / Band 7 family protein n=1 Tax=Trypanosoma theileri TaxID=67003 RepID=A0A1X0NKE1_9TRYP|nr:putative SPFH domain / Band 7 family protein [Trypanosoma theileri]ORC85117.1 putative SPFH domain / Band 7 family protein [Trypanosoma theileri]